MAAPPSVGMAQWWGGVAQWRWGGVFYLQLVHNPAGSIRLSNAHTLCKHLEDLSVECV